MLLQFCFKLFGCCSVWLILNAELIGISPGLFVMFGLVRIMLGLITEQEANKFIEDNKAIRTNQQAIRWL